MRTDSEHRHVRGQVLFLLSRHCAVRLAVLLVIALLPATLRAECGDYVIMGAAKLGSSVVSSSKSMSHDLPHVPCHGPHCSRGTPSHHVPIPTVSSTPEHWGCMLTVYSVVDVRSSCQFSKEHSPFAEALVQAIYHPPRPDSPLRSSC